MNRPSHRESGVVILEALVAILIFSVGILALIGLQANSIKNSSEAKYRADASFLANEVVGEIWANRAAMGSFSSPPSAWLSRVASTLPSGSGTIVVDNDPNTARPRATVTVTWESAGGMQHNFVTVAHINGAN